MITDIGIIQQIHGKNTMFDLPKIGIIGCGFVGSAIADSYAGFANVVIIDTDPSKGFNGTYSDLADAEAVFVCVPSPMNDDGTCNTLPLVSTMTNLKKFKGVIISKVTATPNVYEYLQTQYPNLVHIPEFLTAANARNDYANEKWAIIGGDIPAYQREAERIIKYAKPELDSVFCGIGEAAMVKYVTNSFLATKVVFMNEMSQLAQAHGYDWNKIRYMVAKDHRIGITHTQVPGPDGYNGFGGMCFPKDTSALLKYAETLDINLNVLKEAVKKNTLLRLTKT
jgi:UDPglucose 6-dehydrogenase